MNAQTKQNLKLNVALLDTIQTEIKKHARYVQQVMVALPQVNMHVQTE